MLYTVIKKWQPDSHLIGYSKRCHPRIVCGFSVAQVYHVCVLRVGVFARYSTGDGRKYVVKVAPVIGELVQAADTTEQNFRALQGAVGCISSMFFSSTSTLS